MSTLLHTLQGVPPEASRTRTGWPVSCVWLNQIDQTDPMNQINPYPSRQPGSITHFPLAGPWLIPLQCAT